MHGITQYDYVCECQPGRMTAFRTRGCPSSSNDTMAPSIKSRDILPSRHPLAWTHLAVSVSLLPAHARCSLLLPTFAREERLISRVLYACKQVLAHDLFMNWSYVLIAALAFGTAPGTRTPRRHLAAMGGHARVHITHVPKPRTAMSSRINGLDQSKNIRSVHVSLCLAWRPIAMDKDAKREARGRARVRHALDAQQFHRLSDTSWGSSESLIIFYCNTNRAEHGSRWVTRAVSLRLSSTGTRVSTVPFCGIPVIMMLGDWPGHWQ
jgi:hypothetical protein